MAKTACCKLCAGNRSTGKRPPDRHIFLFIGADPNRVARKSDVALDNRVCAPGSELQGTRCWRRAATASAIGDVRCGSVKRVAAAVGEGAQVVAALHAYLAEMDEADAAGKERV
jgi:thioredoxin reductase (NADPH)